jgi:hypothetical protein
LFTLLKAASNVADESGVGKTVGAGRGGSVSCAETIAVKLPVSKTRAKQKPKNFLFIFTSHSDVTVFSRYRRREYPIMIKMIETIAARTVSNLSPLKTAVIVPKIATTALAAPKIAVLFSIFITRYDARPKKSSAPAPMITITNQSIIIQRPLIPESVPAGGLIKTHDKTTAHTVTKTLNRSISRGAPALLVSRSVCCNGFTNKTSSDVSAMFGRAGTPEEILSLFFRIGCDRFVRHRCECLGDL